MNRIQLFHATLDGARELKEGPFRDEEELHKLLERHLRDLLGIDYLDSQHFTGRQHRRFTDTLGLDGQQRPVVIEFKHGQGGGAISQGLDYLYWLEDHKGDFRELVRENLGTERSRNIDFKDTRLLCIAGEFKREDVINAETNTRQIELLCVRRLGESTILLDWVLGGEDVPKSVPSTKPSTKPKQFSEEPDFSKFQNWRKVVANPRLHQLLMDLCEFMYTIGDDVLVNPTQKYISFKRKRTVAYVKPQTGTKRLLVYVYADMERFVLREGFSRLMHKDHHFPPCNVQIYIENSDSLEEAKDLLKFSYQKSG